MQDVNANVVVNGVNGDDPDLRPVRPGETVPVDWAVYNDGSRKATGLAYVLTLPAGVTFDTCRNVHRADLRRRAGALPGRRRGDPAG